MIQEVCDGASSWTSVDLLVGDVGHEGIALRAALEQMGIRVNLFEVGQAKHVVNLLSGHECTASYVILDLHGNKGRFLLPELASQVEATQPFSGCLTPTDLATFVHLPGRVVLSLACSTGCEALAQAFLDHGCVAYIGPEGGPFGYGSFCFAVLLFYELTHRPRWIEGVLQPAPLNAAVERVRAYDEQMAMFRLFAA
jgi:hypothetical protein